MKVKIVNKSNNALPEYGSKLAAGMDVRASFNCINDIKFTEGRGSIFDIVQDCDSGEVISCKLSVGPNSRFMVPTGLYMAIEEGYEAQVRSRSGKSLKEGLMVVQGVGTIDADYRGECKVCLVNLSQSPQCIEMGERIAQFVFKKCEVAEFEELNDVSELDKTTRGAGGFGHTGKL